MKKFFARVSNGFVELPDPVKLGIEAVVVWLLAALFTNLILLVPFLAFLVPFQIPIAMALAAALIGWLEQIIPDAWGTVAVYAIQFVLALLAMIGVGQTLVAQGALPALLSLQ